MIARKIKIFLEMIKFEHSIFALPFAYLGLFLASNGLPKAATFFWVTLAMVALRTAGMSLNRLIDQPIDAENPRTKMRALPSGLLTRRFAWVIAWCSIAVFIYSARELNSLCFRLSPIPVFFVWIYPYLKRWTWISHWVLGLTLGMAPYGGWLAVRPEWSWIPGMLAFAVATWVGGFDVFYALQDVQFDKSRGLKSLPARFGIDRSVLVAKSSQGFTVLAFIVLGILFPLGLFYWIGVIAVSILIYREHQLVTKFGLAQINEAFFNMNAWVSVVIFVATFLDLTFIHHG